MVVGSSPVAVTKQSDNEKSHREKINGYSSFIPEVMKISSDKAHEQDCISKLRNIRVKNVITGPLNINFLASKFDEYKLVVSGIFDILIITETKIDNTFPTSQSYSEGFSMPHRLDRNRNDGGIIIYVREDIPIKILTKHNLPEDIEGLFLEINFRKCK